MASYLSYMYIAVSRLFNHPNLIGILAILLENPKSWPICNHDRKNRDFGIGSDTNIQVNKNENDNQFSKHFRQKNFILSEN